MMTSPPSRLTLLRLTCLINSIPFRLLAEACWHANERWLGNSILFRLLTKACWHADEPYIILLYNIAIQIIVHVEAN